MKKLFFKLCIFVAAMTATVGLSSCSQDEVESTTSKTVGSKAISFNVTTDNAKGTRGTATTSSNYLSQVNDFAVWAFYGTDYTKTYFGNLARPYYGSFDVVDNKLNGTIINGDGKGSWSYADATTQAYWPSDSLSFIAVTPSSNQYYDSGIPDEEGEPTFSYFVPENQSEQVDVMIAGIEGQTQSTNNGVVPLQFKHVLSRVAFQAKTDNAKLSVQIEAINIHNIIKQVTVNGLAFKDGKRSGYSGHYVRSLDYFASNFDGEHSFNNYGYGATSYPVVISKPVTVTASSNTIAVSDTDKDLILAPQNYFNDNTPIVSTWKTTHPISSTTSFPFACHYAEITINNHQPFYKVGSYLEIKCKIKYGDSYLLGSADEYGTTYVPFEPSWLSGNKYTYVLNFGGGYDENGHPILKPITYTVSSSDWTDATSSSVTL